MKLNIFKGTVIDATGCTKTGQVRASQQTRICLGIASIINIKCVDSCCTTINSQQGSNTIYIATRVGSRSCLATDIHTVSICTSSNRCGTGNGTNANCVITGITANTCYSCMCVKYQELITAAAKADLQVFEVAVYNTIARTKTGQSCCS